MGLSFGSMLFMGMELIGYAYCAVGMSGRDGAVWYRYIDEYSDRDSQSAIQASIVI